MSHVIEGVYCAAATPVTEAGEPNLPSFADHCRKLLKEGCHGVALLGTTGEANSFGIAQRETLLDATIDAGIPAQALLPGTSATSVADTLRLTRHAVLAGVKGTVLLPPFYYKGVSDEGLFRFYAQVIEGVGEPALRAVLYHIPQVSQVPLGAALIERLMREFPGIVVGIKDSSGDIDNMRSLAEQFPDLGVLAGADPMMLPLLKAGGAGCITATSNLRADALRVVWDHWANPDRETEVEAAQDRINEWRSLSNAYIQLPTIKTMLARRRDDLGWLNLLPPLVKLPEAERQDVWTRMDALRS